MKHGGHGEDEVSCSSPSSWSWTPLVPFERVVAGLREAAGYLYAREPDSGRREGDPGAEQVLAHYDRLLLRAARMLEIPLREGHGLTSEQREALVAELAARGLDDIAWHG